MFKKRETVVQNIAYLALMAAINVIFVLITYALPPLMFILIFVLPLSNTVVTLFCKKRYFPIYAFVTVAICLATSFGIGTFDTFFYVIPSIITGFIFGILIEKNISGIHILVATTVVQYVLTFLTFLSLNLIMPGNEFFDVFFNMFGLQSFKFKEIFKHEFCFLLAFIQMIFTYVIIKFEIRKLGYEINLNDNIYFISDLAVLLCLILSIIMYFVYPPLVYVFISTSIIYFCYQLIQIICAKNKVAVIISGAIILLSGFAFALLYQFPVKPLSIILLSIPVGLIMIVHFTYNCLNKKQN